MPHQCAKSDRLLELEATLTRSVEPTSRMSPTRPMMVNSAIVFMVFNSFRFSGEFRLMPLGPSGSGSMKPGEQGQHPRAKSERAEA